MESRLDTAVASLETLIITFRQEPSSGVEWAITSCVILLQHILRLRSNSSQGDETGPAAAYASLLKLCLVDCPTLLADVLACLESNTAPSAWRVLALLLQLPDADKAVYPCFVRTLAQRSAARDSWAALLDQLGKILCATCSAASSSTTGNKQALRGMSLLLTSIWYGCSMLHGRLLHELKGPQAVDLLAAQWAEQLGMTAAGHCLGIMEGASGWDDEAWSKRGMLLRTCGCAFADFLCGDSMPGKDSLQPAFSMLSATSRAGQPSARIPGRQAVAAVITAVVLAQHALRLAGRIPLSHWAEDHNGADSDGVVADCLVQPWDMCRTAAVVASRWLEQQLPARPGGPAPVVLVSLLEVGAAPGVFKSMLSLMATQRKVVRKWAVALAVDPVAWRGQHPTVKLLIIMEKLVIDTSWAALALARRAFEQPRWRSFHRCLESVAAVALWTAHALRPLLAPYEHWAWQQGPQSWPKPFSAHIAGLLMHALGQCRPAKGGAEALLSGTALLLQGPGVLGQGTADLGKDQASWMAWLCDALGIKARVPYPGLLLAAVQGGLLRSLAGWGQQACQHLKKGEAQGIAKLLKVLDVVFVRCCEAVARHILPAEVAHKDHLTHRQLADLRAALTSAWEARSRELTPQMEAAAAWGTHHVVAWSSGGGSNSSSHSSGAGGSRGGAQISGSGGDGAVLPPGAPSSLTLASAAKDLAVAAASLRPAVPGGRRNSPGAARPASQPEFAGCMTGTASPSPSTVNPGGRDQQPGDLAQQQQQQQQQQQGHLQPWTLHGNPAAPHTCPLGQVQTELALGGLLCAHPACPNFSGTTEAALPLQSPSCAMDDWSRHRAACNAFRSLRRGQASVQPAWNLMRQQHEGREHRL
ncbi:hypothetical protein N2152v2_000895 [Parachlorella kessleri]